MINSRTWILTAVLLGMAGIFASCGAPAEPSEPEVVSLESLLKDMTDRARPARLPSAEFTCRQFSSYDRDAVSPDDPDTWFANWDRSQFLRVEENEGRKEFVLMDAEGPGAVVRWWSTWHGPEGGLFSNGTLRIYLDGGEEPVISGPYADILSRGRLAGPPLSYSVSPLTEYRRRGHNLYLPIPYAEHARITYEPRTPMDRGGKTGEALYYQINYRTYEKGTKVTTFSMDQMESAAGLLAATAQKMASRRRGLDPDWPRSRLNRTLNTGEAAELNLDGPGAIRQLVVRLEAEDPSQALRSTVLEILFDAEPTVWCPVGDFFGTGYLFSPYRSWYTEATEDGSLASYWVMPFRESARVRLVNHADFSVTIRLAQAVVSPWDWDERSLYFYSGWHQMSGIDTAGKKDMTGIGAFDVNYVEISGRGTYVGDTLTLFNPVKAWWGEGDEKIYVDGEIFPSHFGTGTEDYYGYAWCRPEVFEAPFHAQPRGEGNLAPGFTVDSRWRALDGIPFQKSLKFDMEMWHWTGTTINCAPAVFWYARPGATSNLPPDIEEAKKKVLRGGEDLP